MDYSQINDLALLEESTTERDNQTVQLTYESTEWMRHRYHKIRMINVPIKLGYRLDCSNNAFSTNIGIYMNVKTEADGNIIGTQAEENLLTFVDVRDQSIYKSNIGLSYSFELGYHRSIYKDIELSIRPIFRIFPNSINNSENNPVDQTYSTYGLNVGLSKNL